jgi:hypothetical protein
MSRRDDYAPDTRGRRRERRHEPETIVLPEPEPLSPPPQRRERVSPYPIYFDAPRTLNARSTKPIVLGFMSDAAESLKAAWPV